MAGKEKPDPVPAQDMAAKRQLHEKADGLNKIEVIRGRSVLTCGARKKRGPGFCKASAGRGTQHPGFGRCKHCGGATTGPTTAAGKAVSAQNGRKHGLYSQALSPEEKAIYEAGLEEAAIGLQHEIYMLKAKITVYLTTWRRKWTTYYERKLAENYKKYQCANVECNHTMVMGELSFLHSGTKAGEPGYCRMCQGKDFIVIDQWLANRTEEEAEIYADDCSKVFYSEGEGARSFYHGGTLEDRTLDRALNTLSRLIEKHARLNPDEGDDLLGRVNAELRSASKGKVSISWSGPAQQKVGGVPDGKQAGGSETPADRTGD